MLIVTVKDEEEIVLTRDGALIGRIKASARRDGKMRLAFDFPKDIRIMRGELARKESDDGTSR